MQNKLITGQYYNLKNQYMKNNPFYCLVESKIDMNPHQIEAFLFALSHLRNGGVILADEVGLGKTIEAGLIIKYHILCNKNKILLIVPSTLRKQWQLELEDKFSVDATVLDSDNLDANLRYAKCSRSKPVVFICSYNFASRYCDALKDITWDFILFDEAHKLRNVHKSGVKLAKNILRLTSGIPKVMLTATPVQNNLYDIYGLFMFIDERILFDKRSFYLRYVKERNYEELKEQIKYIVKRTLRKDIAEYVTFRSRTSMTVDFCLSEKEAILYEMVNQYLKKEILFALPPSNRNLITIIIRKLLASSSYAVAETFEVLKKRLEVLKESTHEVSVDKSLDFFFEFIDEDDDIDTDDDSKVNNELFDRDRVNDFIQHEIDELNNIIDLARSIEENSKGVALLKALSIAFERQRENEIAEKAVIFTESVRTQKYLYELLRANGYDDEIIMFNGGNTDEHAQKIYRAWKAKNFGKELSNRSVEIKHAIVDYFRANSKILLVTDAGSEGLNLQFCNTVINYDLPWNPQKIEQRIGRCHRYGQKHDTLVLNLLNMQNFADKRVYELLSSKLMLFEGVFGSSDQVLGLLESGRDFEKRILYIYQNCNTVSEFSREFNQLEKEFERKRNKGFQQLKNLFGSYEGRGKSEDYKNIISDVKRYFEELECSEKNMAVESILCELRLGGELSGSSKINFTGGIILFGSIISEGQLLQPVLVVKDNTAGIIKDERVILKVLGLLKGLKEESFNKSDMRDISECTETVYRDFMLEYHKKNNDVIAYEKVKIDNWGVLKKDFYNATFEVLETEIEQLKQQSLASRDFKEKIQIGKMIKEKEQKRNEMMGSYHNQVLSIDKEVKNLINDYESRFIIKPEIKLLTVIKYCVGD